MQSHTEIIRIKFINGQQKEFIEQVYFLSNLNTAQLSSLVGIHPRSFRDWRRERLTMQLIAAKKFCQEFGLTLPEDESIMISRWRLAKKDASRVGGVALFKKHGSPATLEGRRKGGIKSIANLRKNGLTPSVKYYKKPAYGEDLAEYVGIMLGDGGITPGQCTVTCNSIADKDYINFVAELGAKLFGEKPKSFKKKDCNAITLYYNGSALTRYFVTIGLKVGNKVKQQIGVPGWIKSNKKYQIACLRGLMDTDGGIFLHKYRVNGKIYVYRKICFSNRSIPLLLFTVEVLKSLGFSPKIVDKVENKKVWLYNQNEVGRYLQVVGSHNERLLKFLGG